MQRCQPAGALHCPAGFSNTGVLTVLALFVVAEGVTQTGGGLDMPGSAKTLQLAASTTNRLSQPRFLPSSSPIQKNQRISAHATLLSGFADLVDLCCCVVAPGTAAGLEVVLGAMMGRTRSTFFAQVTAGASATACPAFVGTAHNACTECLTMLARHNAVRMSSAFQVQLGCPLTLLVAALCICRCA